MFNHEGEIILFEHEEQERMVLCEVLFHHQKQFHEEYIEEFKIRVIDDEFLIYNSASDSKDFKERFNKHVLTPDRIKECEAARRLFSHGRSK